MTRKSSPALSNPLMLLYYITDRRAFPGDESARRRRLLDKIAEAVRAGVDYIQLREKDLPAAELEQLARDAVRAVRQTQPETRDPEPVTKLLINSRTDIALSTDADGVHLRCRDISPHEVRTIVAEVEGSGPAKLARDLIISVACRSVDDVRDAASAGATLAVLAPVFGKQVASQESPAEPLGINVLRRSAGISVPVFALGGVTLENAQLCREAGCAGIAAIRLFQENDVAAVVRCVRANSAA